MIIRGFEKVLVLHDLHQIIQFHILGNVKIGNDSSLGFPVLRTLWSSDALELHDHVAKSNVVEKEVCEGKVLKDLKVMREINAAGRRLVH